MKLGEPENLDESQISKEVKSFGNENAHNILQVIPKHILTLSPEGQRNMAESLSKNNKALALALQNLWHRGIETEAFTTHYSHNMPMMQFSIKEDDIENQLYIKQLIEAIDAKYSIHYDYMLKNFSMRVFSDNLYSYLQKNTELKIENIGRNIFIEVLQDELNSTQEKYLKYFEHGSESQELRDEIIAERNSLNKLRKKYDEVNKKLEKECNEEHEIMPEKKGKIQNFFNRICSLFYKTKVKENLIKSRKPENISKKSRELTENIHNSKCKTTAETNINKDSNENKDLTLDLDR